MILNERKQEPNSQRKPKANQKCPTCYKNMNVCPEEKNLYFCPDCFIHVRNCQIVTVNSNGDYSQPLGHVNDKKTQLKVVKPVEQPTEEDKPEPQDLDFYFASGDKKKFKAVLSNEPKGTWIMLEKPDGKIIMINANNVNWIEEV